MLSVLRAFPPLCLLQTYAIVYLLGKICLSNITKVRWFFFWLTFSIRPEVLLLSTHCLCLHSYMVVLYAQKSRIISILKDYRPNLDSNPDTLGMVMLMVRILTTLAKFASQTPNIWCTLINNTRSDAPLKGLDQPKSNHNNAENNISAKVASNKPPNNNLIKFTFVQLSKFIWPARSNATWARAPNSPISISSQINGNL